MRATAIQSNNSISNLVKSKVMRFQRGHVFTPESLNIEGSHEAVLRTLSRLVEKGVIQRVHKGVYYKPEISTLFKGKVLPPDLNKTIKVISRSNKEKLQVHGAVAANKLGISNQVPMTKIYYTTGPSRELVIAGSKVKFVHSENKALFEATEPELGLIVSAMHYLGQDLVNEEVVSRIKSRVSSEQYEKLKKLKLTGWMKSVLTKSNNQYA